RDAAAVVVDADAAVGEDRHVDEVAVPRERLVDRVVDDLVDEVVETTRPGRADVHAGALADRFEALEHLGGTRPVTGLGRGRTRGICQGRAAPDGVAAWVAGAIRRGSQVDFDSIPEPRLRPAFSPSAGRFRFRRPYLPSQP